MKKLISLVVVFVVAFAFGVYTYATEMSEDYEAGYEAGHRDGYSEGYDDGSSSSPRVPKILFLEPGVIPEVAAGSDFELTVDYINDSAYGATDIVITPSFEDVPFVYEGPIVYRKNRTLAARKEDKATFNFKVDDSAKVGVYAIKFTIDFKNTRDDSYSTQQTVYFRVSSEKVKSILTIDSFVTTPSRVVAGENFVLDLNINNIGDIEATNASLKVTGLSKDGFMAVNSKDYTYIGSISPKVTKTYSFDLVAASDIPKGSNTLGINLTYTDSDGEIVNEEKTIYILDVVSENEKEDDSDFVGRPKVMISSYSTKPNNIVAGDLISFSFKFVNTSGSKNIKNMKITLNSAEGAFMIAKGSNTFYVETLAPKESLTRTIELNVKQDLTSKSYPIDIEFDYEDTAGNSYTSTEIINLPVTEYSKLVINSVYVGEAFVNGVTSLSFDYINMGKAAVSNLTASVEGDYTSNQSINYIGNLSTGTSDYYDIEVIPTKAGENYGTLVLGFEDSSGKIIEVRKEFQGYAMEEQPFVEPDPGMDIPIEPIVPEEKTVSVWVLVGAGVGTLLVVFIITKVITTKIIRKKLEDEI